MGVEFCPKTLIINDKIIKLAIWDTAGQERFKYIIDYLVLLQKCTTKAQPQLFWFMISHKKQPLKKQKLS